MVRFSSSNHPPLFFYYIFFARQIDGTTQIDPADDRPPVFVGQRRHADFPALGADVVARDRSAVNGAKKAPRVAALGSIDGPEERSASESLHLRIVLPADFGGQAASEFIIKFLQLRPFGEPALPVDGQ